MRGEIVDVKLVNVGGSVDPRSAQKVRYATSMANYGNLNCSSALSKIFPKLDSGIASSSNPLAIAHQYPMSTPTVLRPMARKMLRSKVTQHIIPPIFLLPSLLAPTSQQTPFSTTSPNSSRTRDNNPERGVSTARRTGLREPVSISKLPIPKPVRADKLKAVEVDPNHGLYGFFHSKDKPLATPEENAAYGRPWCVEELRGKSWEDLHALWWVCAKERNRLATEKNEIKRLGGMYGENEINHRVASVRRTQRGIKHALTERYYSWREAEILAKNDPEIDLSGEGPIYTPGDYMEDDEDIPEELTEEEAKELEALEAQEAEDAKRTKESISAEAIPESKPLEKQTTI